MYFVIHTKFQIPHLPAMNEFAVLSRNVNIQCQSILGSYACVLYWRFT